MKRRTRWPGEAEAGSVLDTHDIRDEAGRVRFRFTRYFSVDGTRWVCLGPFAMFHPNGGVATEGECRDGLETGTWREFHDNGEAAAEGMYCRGKEEGYWRFWAVDGTENPAVEYVDGEEATPSCPGLSRGRGGRS